MRFNHSEITQEKLEECNLFNDTPKANCESPVQLGQIEALDELSYAAYKRQKKNDKRSRIERSRNDHKTSNKKKKNAVSTTDSATPKTSAGIRSPNLDPKLCGLINVES